MAKVRPLAVAAGVAVLGGGIAKAVDLPPVPSLPAESPAAEDFSGWYLRGDLGFGVSSTGPRLATAPDPIAAGASSGLLSSSAGAAFSHASLSPFGAIDAGAGYRFNTWLRMDGTLEYRGGARLEAHSSLTDPASPAFGPLQFAESYRADVSSLVGLLNGYVDLGTYWGVTPFVGAGAGFADNRVSEFADDGFGSSGSGALTSAGSFANGSKSSFAWALMAGVDFDVAPGVKVELGYRYLDMGSLATGASHCPAWGAGGALSAAGCSGGVPHTLSSRGALASSDFRVGLIWMLNELPLTGHSDGVRN